MHHFIHLKETDIEKQLELEQKLLREHTSSFVLINDSPKNAIVMGSSQKPHEVIHLSRAKERRIPIIRRFSAGGCVILDQNSVMVSFILNKKDINDNLYPQSIMNWTKGFYESALGLPSFTLTENDYTIGNHKVGGNAQYIRKDRFCHHTSFLWDYDKSHMDLLCHPPKEPTYRDGRHHFDFLTTLKPHLTKEAFIDKIRNEFDARFSLSALPEKIFD